MQSAVTNLLLRFPISKLKDFDQDQALALFQSKFAAFFGRAPTAQEIAYWSQEFKTKPLPIALAEIVAALKVQADSLFQQVFGRAMTAQDFTAVVVHFANGGTLTQLQSQWLASITTPSPQSCAFNGQTVAHGQSVTAFVAGTAASFSATCVSQTRTCNNGVLSGTYLFSSCTVPSASSDQIACGNLNGHLVTVPANFAIVQNGSWGSYNMLCNSKAVLGGVYCPSDVKNGKTFQSVAESGLNIAPFVNLYGPGSCNDSVKSGSAAHHRMLQWTSVCCGN
jgi:hypothetical protein